MPAPELDQFRQEHPEYSAWSDRDLAESLYDAHYSHEWDEGAFMQRMGIEPIEPPPPEPTMWQRITGAAKEQHGGDPDNLDLALALDEGSHGVDRAPEAQGPGVLGHRLIGAAFRDYIANRAMASGVSALDDYQAAVDRMGAAEDQPIRPEGTEELAALRRRARKEVGRAFATRRRVAAANAGISPSEVTKELLMAPTLFGDQGAIGKLADAPLTAMVEITAQSLPNMIDSIALGLAGSLAGPGGTMAGFGLGSAMSEYRASLVEGFERAGFDLSDPDQFIEAYSDRDLVRQIHQHAATRGEIIGLFDGVSAGIAGKALGPAVKGVVGKLVSGGLQVGAQGALGAGGEAAAQLATEGEVARPGEVVAEFVGEMGSAFAEGGLAAVTRAQEVGSAEIIGPDTAAIIEETETALKEVEAMFPDEGEQTVSAPAPTVAEPEATASDVAEESPGPVAEDPVEESAAEPEDVTPDAGMEVAPEDPQPAPAGDDISSGAAIAEGRRMLEEASDVFPDHLAVTSEAEIELVGRQSLQLRRRLDELGFSEDGPVATAQIPGLSYEAGAHPLYATSTSGDMQVTLRVPLDRIYTSQDFLTPQLEQRLFAKERPLLTPQPDGRFHIDDGNHRTAIAALMGQEDVEVDVYAGPGYRSWMSEDWAAAQLPPPRPMAVSAAYIVPEKKIIEKVGDEGLVAVRAAIEQALAQDGVTVAPGKNGNYTVSAKSIEDMEAAVDLANAILSQTQIETDRGGLRGARLAKKSSGVQSMHSPTFTPVKDEVLDLTPGPNAVPVIGLDGTLPVDANDQLVLGNGRKLRIPQEPVRRRHIMSVLARHFGLGIYEGRIRGPKSRLGFYRKNHGELRIRDGNDIEVLAHEFGHWMDERFQWVGPLYANFADEMKAISYDKSSVEEGYAEYMRLFMTQEAQAMRRAPNFDTHFRQELAKKARRADAKVIYDVQEMMHAWMQQGARARLQSKIDSKDASFFEKVSRLIPQNVRQKVVDGLHAVKKAELDIVGNEAGGVYRRMRLAYGGYNGAVEAAYFYGTPGFRKDGQGIELSGQGLRQIFGQWWGDQRLAEYMVARRAAELDDRGMNQQFRQDEIEAGLEHEVANPEFRAIFEGYQAFNQRLLDFAEDAGILSAEVRQAITEANKSYIPFYRVVESLFDGKTAKPHSNPFMRMQGGTDNISNVWENIVMNTGVIIRSSFMNDAKRSLFQMIERADNQAGALYAAPIQAASKAHTFSRERLKAVLIEEMGMTPTEYTAALNGMGTPAEVQNAQAVDRVIDGLQELVTIYSGTLDPQGNVDMYMDGGKKQFFEIQDRDLMDSMKFLQPRGVDGVLKVLSGFTRTLRRGVTATPAFQFNNFGRDTVQAWLSGKNEVPAAQALKDLMSHFQTQVSEAASYDMPESARAYAEMLVNGGGFATRSQGLQPYGQSIVDPRGWLNFYDRVMGGVENANRIAEFQAARLRGESPRDAAFQSREISTDFALRGSSAAVQNLAMMIPFFNARLQGAYVMARKMGPGSDVRTSLAIKGTALAMASVLLYLLTRDDERIQEAPEDVKDRFWLIPFGDREDDIAALPKPFEFGFLFGSVPQRIAELADKKDGRTFTEAMKWMLMQTLHADMTPQAFKPWIDLQMNRNFAGSPIVPFYLEAVEPDQQYTHYTSLAMRQLGAQLNVSPLQAEYIVRGYLGTMGTYALGASDALIRAAGYDYGEGDPPAAGETWRDSILVKGLTGKTFREGPQRRTKSLKQLYDMVKETERAARTFSLKQKRGAADLAEWMERPGNAEKIGAAPLVRKAKLELRQIRAAMDAIRVDSGMSGEEKRDRLWALTRQRNRYQREMVDALKGMGLWQ